jgi:hypothetical protein
MDCMYTSHLNITEMAEVAIFSSVLSLYAIPLEIYICVVSNGISSPDGRRLQACSETLYVFAKCVPQFLVRHASHLLPYLSEKGTVRRHFLLYVQCVVTVAISLPNCHILTVL